MSKTNSEWGNLAKETGSKKGLDPIPPDQYLTFQDARYLNRERLWSWMLGKTMRKGHRTAWATDTKGNILQLKDAEKELQLSQVEISQAWAILDDEGRVRRHGAKLYLCGEVKLPAKLKSERKANEHNLYKIFPTYILLQINKLEEKAKCRFFAQQEQLEEQAEQLEADLIAAARVIVDRQYDALFAQYQIEKRRHEKPAKRSKPVPPEHAAVRLEILPHLENSVQNNLKFCTKSVLDGVQNPAAPLVHALPPDKEGIRGYSSEDSAGGRASLDTTPSTQQPEAARPPALPPDFVENLAVRNLLPDGELAPRIYQEIQSAEMPLSFFFQELDKRMERGKVGTGLLLKITQGAIEKWRPLAAEAKQRESKEAQQRQEQQERYAKMAREILEDPNATEDEKQIARQALAG